MFNENNCLENLKPEIRSKFQTELFNAWHSIYIKPAKDDPTEDRPEIKKQESTPLMEAEKSPEVDAKEQTSAITEEQPIKSEKEKKVASSEDTDLRLKKEPAKEQSPLAVPKTSVHQFENDWFDKLLDFFAAIVGYVSGIVGH
jgi:hypothetical protein